MAELRREVRPLSWECVAFLKGPLGWPCPLEGLLGGLRPCKASPFVFSLEVTARKAMDKALDLGGRCLSRFEGLESGGKVYAAHVERHRGCPWGRGTRDGGSSSQRAQQ